MADRKLPFCVDSSVFCCWIIPLMRENNIQLERLPFKNEVHVDCVFVYEVRSALLFFANTNFKTKTLIVASVIWPKKWYLKCLNKICKLKKMFIVKMHRHFLKTKKVCMAFCTCCIFWIAQVHFMYVQCKNHATKKNAAKPTWKRDTKNKLR